ncbi:transcriptional regulator, TetR family [Corynebacterium uterequi]|uniref:Transcriptional regulator, TetR family n=2 Tax=Corynebacterium uterequi TaxID=1072256 RepID=A0A0G3HFA6_9CORY|nr:transcriptional regulator, TetR family [Corynebacterium uterequi]
MCTVHLQRDTIVDAATEILDTYGLADMTMRRVATQLQVAPGALYWHVPNKQALLAAVAARILSPCLSAGAPSDAREFCGLLYEQLRSVTDAADVVAAALAPAESPLRSALHEQLRARLSGVDDAELVADALVLLIVGATAREQLAGSDTPSVVAAYVDLVLRGC